MKITIKIDSDTLFLLKACFDLYRNNDGSHAKTREEKSNMAMFFNLRTTFAKKAITLVPNGKDFKIKLPYYLANMLYDFVCNQLQLNVAFGIYERTKMELLRNDLHQQLL